MANVGRRPDDRWAPHRRMEVDMAKKKKDKKKDKKGKKGKKK